MLVEAEVADLTAELVVLVVLVAVAQGHSLLGLREQQILAAAAVVVDMSGLHTLVLLVVLVLSSLERYPRHLPQQDRLQ